MTEHNNQPDNITVSRELLLHAIEFVGVRAKEAHSGSHVYELFTALRNALEQPAVEPVAWIKTSDKYPPAGVRVFWFNPQYNHVGYDTWMGEDYRFNAEYWMHIPDIAPQAQQPKVEPDNLKCKSVQKRLATLWGYVEAQQPVQCKHCTKFSSQYRCNASQGECDCPKCQGLCTCSQQPQLLTDEQIEALKRAWQEAMYRTGSARIPECGWFGGIAQDLDFVLSGITGDSK